MKVFISFSTAGRYRIGMPSWFCNYVGTCVFPKVHKLSICLFWSCSNSLLRKLYWGMLCPKSKRITLKLDISTDIIASKHWSLFLLNGNSNNMNISLHFFWAQHLQITLSLTALILLFTRITWGFKYVEYSSPIRY